MGDPDPSPQPLNYLTPGVPHRPGSRRKFVITLITVGVLACALSVIIPSFNRYRPVSGRGPCPSNLRQIGHAIRLYAMDFGGQFPPTLDFLLNTQRLPVELLDCPGDEGAGRRGTLPPSPDSVRWPDRDHNYAYTGAGLDTSAPSDLIIARDRSGNHADGVYLLFADGRVESVSADKLAESLRASDMLRAEWEATKGTRR